MTAAAADSSRLTASRAIERERRENVRAYATVLSLREILLVRSTAIAAELLHRRRDGSWPEQPLLVAVDDAIELRGIDFASPLAAFHEDTLLRSQPGR